MKKLRIGFVGLGAMSSRLYAGLMATGRVEVTALCTRSRSNLEEHCRSWGVERGYTDYRELVAQPAVDAVVISVPPVLHREVTLAALEAGKHVFCEKPPAMNAQEAREMMDCAQARGLVLMYGFLFRFSRKHNVGRDILLSGRLGEIRLVRLETLRRNALAAGWFTQRNLAGGGPVIDIGAHCLDMARYMMGGGELRPVSVYAKTFAPCPNLQGLKDYDHGWPTFLSDAAKPCRYDVEEMATATITYNSGAVALMVLSNAAHIQRDKKVTEFIGTLGGLTVDPELEVHTVVDHRLADLRPVVDCAKFDYQESIDLECANLVESILDGAPCRATGEDGWILMKLIDAIYRSAQTGQAVEINYTL